jgi:hypothetical protein
MTFSVMSDLGQSRNHVVFGDNGFLVKAEQYRHKCHTRSKLMSEDDTKISTRGRALLL